MIKSKNDNIIYFYKVQHTQGYLVKLPDTFWLPLCYREEESLKAAQTFNFD